MSAAGLRCSILIPVHGEAELALECLRSIAACEDCSEAEIIVIDDASPTADRAALAAYEGPARILYRDARGGFAGAVTTGLDACSGDRPYVAILNSDVMVEPGWLCHLVRALDSDPQLGSCAPCVLDQESPHLIDSAGLAYTLSGWSFRRGHGRPLGEEWAKPTRVFGVTGTAALLRWRALHEIGEPFPSEFDGYYEDVTLAFRLQELGWESLYVPDSRVLHRGSASYSRYPNRKSLCVSRNLEVVFWTHLPSRYLIAALPRHALFAVAHAWRAVLQGTFRAHCRGKLQALRRSAWIRSARAQRRGQALFLTDPIAAASLRAATRWLLGVKTTAG